MQRYTKCNKVPAPDWLFVNGKVQYEGKDPHAIRDDAETQSEWARYKDSYRVMVKKLKESIKNNGYVTYDLTRFYTQRVMDLDEKRMQRTSNQFEREKIANQR